MEEFCLEEDFLRFLNELPEDLFDQNEEKVIMSSFDIFKSECLGMTPATPEPNLRFPVQVEDSNLYHVAAQELSGEQSALPQFITNSSNYRETSTTVSCSRKRKQATTAAADDVLLGDSDSDDVGSSCSAPESEETSLKFAERFLALGIHCKQNFWQYNQESRGPKAKRLLPALDEGDIHVLNGCINPTFDSTQNAVVSSDRDKARHVGGSDDLRPDPLKLLLIGSRISGMEEVFKSKDIKESGKKKKRKAAIGREKNILASRICRLRKKAQYEANKIKLEGLQKEQNQLISVSLNMLNVMHEHIVKSAVQQNAGHSTTSLCTHLKASISEHLGSMVAGHSVEFVNRELETVSKQLLSGDVTVVGEQSDGEG